MKKPFNLALKEPQNLGRLIGTDYAEDFMVERHLAVNSLGDLI